MQINLTGHHVDLTDSLRDYVESKLGKLERHFDQVVDVQVILSVEKLRQKAEATVHVSGTNLYADDTQEDMYGLIDKLDRQVKKHKEKITNHHRR